MSDAARKLYEREVLHRVLALREDLVRHDDNMAAWTLLDSAVPYFLRDHPDIVSAREDQREMVGHLLDPDAYTAYYATNPHERPFEDQYGIPAALAHQHLHRVWFLREELARMSREADRSLSLLDLGANDGFMAANLTDLGCVITDCVDLHPGNCDLARRRRDTDGAAIGLVIDAAAEHASRELDASGWPHQYDAVAAFELIEHVRSPIELLTSMRQLVLEDGVMFVSTPDGAVEQGDLPTWHVVERKGHVRALREKDLVALCEEVGTVDTVVRGPDGVLVAAVKPG